MYICTIMFLLCLSQCSTLVRNTVVRAMAQVNGRWRFSDHWGSETPKPMKIKFGFTALGTGPPCKNWFMPRGGSGPGVVVKLSSRAYFF